MGKVIVIHANCHNPTAKGDFAFAGNIAKDLVIELQGQGISDIDVILVSPLEGISKFESLYGATSNHRVLVEGISIGLSSLEEFDAIEHSVIAFIDANRCKHSATALVQRILSPKSKFLFVGNINQEAFSDFFSQIMYFYTVKTEQPGLYDHFSDEDILIGSAGLGVDRLGLPTITKAENLPELSPIDKAILPQGQYGSMYVANHIATIDHQLIAQYIKLSGYDNYILIGNFTTMQPKIQAAYINDHTLTITKPALPYIQYHQSLPNHIMRQVVAQAGTLVLSTGSTSTLEAMRDRKLTYYQDMPNNTTFVSAYLIALKSLVSNDTTLSASMPYLIIKLSKLLFKEKPLIRKKAWQIQGLLSMDEISSKLIDVNQTIIEQASGKLAPRILGFLMGDRKTKDAKQLAIVCSSLRKSGETGSPVHDQALRRAASWGRLFELKVLIKFLSTAELNKVDSTYQRTALHWAVIAKNLDCARALIQAGASLDNIDKSGQTALHKAVKNGDKPLIKVLIEAGASLDIEDSSCKTPKTYAPDAQVLLFINDCYTAKQHHMM